ncbi:MAG: RlmE family RNA methyltransferase [Magnetococcales bacterium]|nr:RlmE family RNA methyltransferase [Magnetococcales bacterium]NGZ29077.1 RlmE family RNA methyltransferase [Magnetococcales bacterium]
MAQPQRSPSSNRWLAEHHADPHVLAARREGYRSRAAYKLLEIQEKYKLLKPGMTVLDLGAAPGGWSQVAASLVTPQGKVVAVDLLPMAAVAPHVTVLQGDFLDDLVVDTIHQSLAGGRAQVILSDMAANMSGNRTLDSLRGERLAEAVFQVVHHTLAPDGILVMKVFQGGAFSTLMVQGKELFRTVRMTKPTASRDRSPEQYMIGLGFRGPGLVREVVS